MTKTTIINENNVKTVTAVEQNACTVYAYGEDQYLNSEGPFFVGKRLVSDSTASRLYAVLEMPELPSNAKIRGAQLSFEQTWVSYGGSPVSPIGIYRVNGEIDQESFTPDDSLIALLDWDNIAGSGNTGISETYDFDITAVIEEYISDPTVHTNFLIKLVNESQVGGLTFSDSSLPVFKVIYEENDGASGSYQSHSHELGSFGRSSVDIVKGDLTLDFSDFEWSGNRMPVAISHRYSSVYAGKQYTNGVAGLSCGNFSGMKLGHGFKLNIMESMKSASFVYNSNSVNGYRYIDGYNDSRYFVPVSGGYAAVDDSDIKYSSSGRTLTGWSEVKTVDSSGRVVRTSDEYGNNIDVTYSSNRITSVKDGAGRSFAFGYDSAGHLTSITAPDGNSADYSYTGELLTGVTCPDGRSVVLAYDSAGRPTSVILKNSSGENVGKTEYAYSNGRVATVTEYGASGGSFVKIAATTYSYSPITRRGLVRTVQETGGTTQ
ncbi:MAG: RHS repeat protein, partial [Clostridia bacterium]|nr:RHS repeat protein [Clostridia bacterium]